MVDIDLTTKYGPLTLKNPVLPGSSEIILNDRQVELAIKRGKVGGIVTKSFIDEGRLPPQTRPAWFPMKRFGPEYQTTWIFDSGGLSPNPKYDAEKLIPKMKKPCKEAEIPLIVSQQNITPERHAY